MSKRIAIIDLGTNTFHLLIAELKRNGHEEILKTKEVVKLAEDGILSISDTAFVRAIKAMLIFKMRLEEHRVKDVYAFGTAAFREAKNGKELIDRAQEYFGITVQQITGDTEATLIYHGVKQAVRLNENPVLIMDIGGGSVEFIIANEKEIFWKESHKIGAAILRKQFHKNEPISKAETEILERFLEKELQTVIEAAKNFSVKKLVGASGAFDTITEMIIHQFYEQDISMGLNHTVTSFDIRKEYFYEVHRQLLNSTLEQRRQNKAIIPYRAEMMVVSSLLINFIVEKVNPQEIKLSTYALKEGVLWCVKNMKKEILVQ